MPSKKMKGSMTLVEARQIPLEGREAPFDESLPGITMIGANGKTDAYSMKERFDKARKTLEYRKYRECVPCIDCGKCLKFRRFDRMGRLKTVGMFCMMLRVNVGRWGSCEDGIPSTHNKNIIVDMTGAPKSFPKNGEEADAAVLEAERKAQIEQAALLQVLMEGEYGKEREARAAKFGAAAKGEGAKKSPASGGKVVAQKAAEVKGEVSGQKKELDKEEKTGEGGTVE